jgi:hypothetical protein
MGGNGRLTIGSNVVVIVRLSNSGTPSSAKSETWQLSAQLADGSVHHGHLVAFIFDETHICTDVPGKAWVVAKEDQIFNKTSRIIDRNGQEEGIVSYAFPEVGWSKLSNGGTAFTLSVQDIAGNVVTDTQTMQRLEARQNGFNVGMKHPIPIDDSGCFTQQAPLVAP